MCDMTALSPLTGCSFHTAYRKIITSRLVPPAICVNWQIKTFIKGRWDGKRAQPPVCFLLLLTMITFTCQNHLEAVQNFRSQLWSPQAQIQDHILQGWPARRASGVAH